MNKRTLKFITKALEVSLESDYKRVQIGTVIVKSGMPVSSAPNVVRSHPRQAFFNQLAGRLAPNHYLHSELHAIIRSRGICLKGAEAFIARYERNGSIGNCEPCEACQEALRRAGIHKAYYTTPDGIKEHSYR